MKWFERDYRRHLCDMHIDDWNSEFLSEFSAKEYVENLKTADISTAMLYFQSHIGLCYYPTKSGKMHNAFIGREDLMKNVVDLCHQNGINVVGYYSINFNNWAAKEHPEWQAIDENGKSNTDLGQRYGICCPNNREYRDFVLAQIKEMLEYFEMEGIFYDMPFWKVPCHCENCKKRFKDEYGYDMPTEGSKAVPDILRARERWMGEFCKEITDYTKKLNPQISVEQNYAFTGVNQASACISERVNDACDYVGGDLCVTAIYQSFACKYFHSVTKNQPFEFMTVRCDPDLSSHTTTKTRDKLVRFLSLTTAHHGANLLIDAIDPVGTLDSRVYKLFGDVLGEVKKYEQYMPYGKLVADVGVYYNQESKINLEGQNFNNYDGSVNTIRNMIENHIPVDCVSRGSINRIGDFKAVVISNPNFIGDDENKKLIEYVKNGGILCFSNTNETELFNTLVGGKLVGYTKLPKSYAAPVAGNEKVFENFCSKWPLPLEYKVPMVDGIESKNILAYINLPYYSESDSSKYASIHSNPPGKTTEYPAVVVKSYGKGKVIWLAGPIEAINTNNHKSVLLNLINYAGFNKDTIVSDAPVKVELVTFDVPEQKCTRISAVHLNDEDFAILQNPFNISFKTSRTVDGVTLLPSGEPVKYTVENGYVSFKTQPLNIFDMYEIKYK